MNKLLLITLLATTSFSAWGQTFDVLEAMRLQEKDGSYSYFDFDNLIKQGDMESLKDDNQEAFMVWCSHGSYDISREDAHVLISKFWDEYHGKYDSEEDFAYRYVVDCYDLPEFAQTYFDYEKFARELFSTDYWFEDGFVFRR